jgi:hypothetical protein
MCMSSDEKQRVVLDFGPLRIQTDKLTRDSEAGIRWHSKRSMTDTPDTLCRYAVSLASQHFPDSLLQTVSGELCQCVVAECQVEHIQAHAKKDEARSCFTRGELVNSAVALTSALTQVNELSHDGSKLAVALYCNRAAVQYQRGLVAASLEDCHCALLCSPNHPKALYRRALARAALADLEGALADVDTLLGQGDLSCEEATSFRQLLITKVRLILDKRQILSLD